MTNICPVCQKDDAVQRVSTLVAAGQSSGTFSGPSGGVTYSNGKWGSVSGYSTLSGSTTSNLARSLASPAKPTKDSGAIQMGCGYVALFAVAVLLLSPIFLDGLLPTSLIVAGILFYGIPGLLFLRSGARKRKLADERYPQVLAKWEEALTRWQRLYFCHRDGIAFDPETNEPFEPTKIQEYIYK